ncbi:DUF4334 domain-containing protein [Cystobacter fuscus]|uniref:DUF4334 domain-containing protein n=1 Tax=Cystobacter fuscus TaxID=43 RepID=UPI002B2DAFB2|nr:DUF4334 domain-containing protein [Cystobacter fuscus]
MTSKRAQRTLDQLAAGTTLAEALDVYDSLAPATPTQMIGSWKGTGIKTGNPFDGLLEHFGWHGKRFESLDEAHPLIFRSGGDRLVSVNPGLMPVGLVARHGQRLLGSGWATAFRLARPLLTTTAPKARLRPVEYRGVVSMAMSYDQLPIIDVFRSIDDDTLMGAMDMRGLAAPFMFVLRRETDSAAGRIA